MTRWSSCGLLLALSLATARPVAAQEPRGPATIDLTLERALELARTGAPWPRVARARIGEARGQLVDAEVLLRSNPTLDFGGGPRLGPAGVGLEVEVGLEQVFELGGPRRARIDAARAGLERAEALAEDEVRRTSLDVAAAFLRARHAEERLRIAAEAQQVVAELHQSAQRRHEAGDAGALDVNLAALTLARVQAEVRTLEAAREQAIGVLRRLLGLAVDRPVNVGGELLDRRRYSLTSLLALARDRADLLVLDADARQADAEVRVGEARAWPELGVRLGYAREEDTDLVLGSVTLTLPFFDRGQGLEATARARGEAARLERQVTEAAIDAGVRAAFGTYQRLLEVVEHFEQQGLPLIEQTDAFARRSYDEGASPLIDLLAVRRELVEARVAYADLLLSAAIAGVELEAETGVLR